MDKKKEVKWDIKANLSMVCPKQVCQMNRQDKYEPARLPDCTACMMWEMRCPDLAIEAMTIQTVKFVQGNEACVEGALYAGLNFCAANPTTPSTEIAELLTERLPRKGGKFVQVEDETASMCAIIGASLAGHKVLTTTSGPGFSLTQEALSCAAMAEIPCVVVNVQRSRPSSGISMHISQDDVNRVLRGTCADHAIIVLTASNHQDVFAMTVEAFNIAEIYRTPVVLILDEVIGKMREKLTIPWPGAIPLVDRLRTSLQEGVGYHPCLPRGDGRQPLSEFSDVRRCHATGLHKGMSAFPSDNSGAVHGMRRALANKIENIRHCAARCKAYKLDDAELVLVSYGASARSALHVMANLRDRGERIGLLELQTLWPFPAETVAQKCRRAKQVAVVEMNTGHMCRMVRSAVQPADKVFLVNRMDGVPITPSYIKAQLRVISVKGI